MIDWRIDDRIKDNRFRTKFLSEDDMFISIKDWERVGISSTINRADRIITLTRGEV